MASVYNFSSIPVQWAMEREDSVGSLAMPPQPQKQKDWVKNEVGRENQFWKIVLWPNDTHTHKKNKLNL